ncbi:MAG TPA: hypothetical protein VF303_01220 [Candidatus Nanoarchaeia archaeon]
MRLTILRNVPKIIIYLGLVFLLLALLAVSGTFDNQGFNKKVSSEKINGQKNKNAETVASESNNNSGSSDQNSEDQNQTSNKTKVRVSVSSNTTNGETTGSTNVKVTTNGKTQDLSEALDECLVAGKIKISTEDSKIECESSDGSVEIDWDSENDTDQKSEFSSDTDINVKNKQRN